MKLTQPVLIQSFSDEFDLPTKDYNTPAEPKSVLRHSEDNEVLSAEKQTKYRSGVGKLMHLMRWSRPEIWNSVRELTVHMGRCNKQHMVAMKRTMKYLVRTPNRGWTIKPKRRWDGKDKNFLFKLSVLPDASYATCKKT